MLIASIHLLVSVFPCKQCVIFLLLRYILYMSQPLLTFVVVSQHNPGGKHNTAMSQREVQLLGRRIKLSTKYFKICYKSALCDICLPGTHH